MKFKQTLLGMVATCALTLGSVNSAYSQTSQKYAQPSQQELEKANMQLREHRGNGDYQAYSKPISTNYRVSGGDKGDDLLAPMALLIFLKLRKHEKRDVNYSEIQI